MAAAAARTGATVRSPEPPKPLTVINEYILSRGSIYTTIMASGPQNHIGDGLLGPDSIIVNSSVYGPSGLDYVIRFKVYSIKGFWRLWVPTPQAETDR